MLVFFWHRSPARLTIVAGLENIAEDSEELIQEVDVDDIEIVKHINLNALYNLDIVQWH